MQSHNKIACGGLGRKNNVPAEVLKNGRQPYDLWVVLQLHDRTSIGCIVIRIRWPLWFEGWTGRLVQFQAPDFFLPPVMPNTRTIVAIHVIKALAVGKIQSSMDPVSELMGSLILQ